MVFAVGKVAFQNNGRRYRVNGIFALFTPHIGHVQVLGRRDGGAALVPHAHRAGQLCRQILGKGVAQLAAGPRRAVHVQGVPHYDKLGFLAFGLPHDLIDDGFAVAAVKHPHRACQQLTSVTDGKPRSGIAVIHGKNTHGESPPFHSVQAAALPRPPRRPTEVGRSGGAPRGAAGQRAAGAQRGGQDLPPAKIPVPL